LEYSFEDPQGRRAIRCGKIGGLDIVKIVYYYTEKPRELEVDTRSTFLTLPTDLVEELDLTLLREGR